MFLKWTGNGWSYVRYASPLTSLPLHPRAVRDQAIWNNVFPVHPPCRYQWPRLACWNCGFESRWSHGCLSLVSVVCCQRSLRGADPSPEESYRLWYIIVCDLQTSNTRRPWPALGCCARNKMHCPYVASNIWKGVHRTTFVSIRK